MTTDTERIERVAQALLEQVQDRIGFTHEFRKVLGDLHPESQQEYIDDARAALDAADDYADLDELLDSVHPKARITWIGQVEDDQWYVEITWTDVDYSLPPPIPHHTFTEVGYGATRMAAIADAVSKAKEQGLAMSSARKEIGRVLDGMDATINLTGEDYRLHRDNATDRIIAIVREAVLSERPISEAIEEEMHEYADVFERALHGFTWNQSDVATAKKEAVDNIITYLWSRADDPEVQAAAAVALAGMDDAECFYRDQARAAITATLTALLGPKIEMRTEAEPTTGDAPTMLPGRGNERIESDE